MAFVKTSHFRGTNALHSCVVVSRAALSRLKISISGDVAKQCGIDAYVSIHVGTGDDAGFILVSASTQDDITAVTTCRRTSPKSPSVSFTVSRQRLFIESLRNCEGSVKVDHKLSKDGVIIKLPDGLTQRFKQ